MKRFMLLKVEMTSRRGCYAFFLLDMIALVRELERVK